jgi:hypothetical protein
MELNMATVRLTFDAVLDTVTSATTFVSTGLGMATGSLEMGAAFIEKAKYEQRKRHIRDAEVFEDRLTEETAEEQTLIDERIMKFCSHSPERKVAYERNYDRFAKLLKTPKAKEIPAYLREAAE